MSRGLHACFRGAVAEGGRAFYIDLRSVSDVDPAGIAVLIVYARLLPSLGGSLKVSAASHPCHVLLRRLQLSHLLLRARDQADVMAAGA
jgi:ABC-type transporter Mla MlaB component